MSGSFSLAVSKFVEQAKDNMNEVKRSVVLQLASAIVERSPVGDPNNWVSKPPPGYIGGHFRANWQIALGQPASGILDEIDAQGIATKKRLAAEVESIYAGSVAHITNNLPYGPRLEFEAWSSQAPQGMVRITVAEFQTMVNNAVKEVTSR